MRRAGWTIGISHARPKPGTGSFFLTCRAGCTRRCRTGSCAFLRRRKFRPPASFICSLWMKPGISLPRKIKMNPWRDSDFMQSGNCGTGQRAGNFLRRSRPGISGNGIGTTVSAADAAARTDIMIRKGPCSVRNADSWSIPASIRPSSSASQRATAC